MVEDKNNNGTNPSNTIVYANNSSSNYHNTSGGYLHSTGASSSSSCSTTSSLDMSSTINLSSSSIACSASSSTIDSSDISCRDNNESSVDMANGVSHLSGNFCSGGTVITTDNNGDHIVSPGTMVTYGCDGTAYYGEEENSDDGYEWEAELQDP